MTNITNTARTFESELFGSLTVITDDRGAPWFIGREVMQKLGYSLATTANISKVFRTHCPDKKPFSTLTTMVSVSGVRSNTAVISEGDFYRLVLGSDLPSAIEFQNWVVEEVLPSIREHGGYVVEQPSMADQRANPEILEEVNQRFSDFREDMRAMITELVPALTASVATAVVTAMRDTAPVALPEPMPEGFTTLEELYSLTQGIISKEAFKSLLRGANWTRSEYDKVLEDGRIVRLTCWAKNCNFHGEVININQLVDRVCREARPISVYYYEHRLIVGRFRINA